MQLISIIILNWNGKQHLQECLDSVLAQTYKNIEIILVDNGSTDGSAQYVRDMYPEIKVLELDQNYGFCKGNNEGIRISKGEYIVLLNNDTVADKQWLERLLECMISDKEIGFCASKLVSYYDKDTLDAAGDGFSVCGAGFKRGFGYSQKHYDDSDYVFGACAGAAMYKRSMLDEIGLLDEDFFITYEDSDLSFRAQLAGYKCKYQPQAVVYHKVNASMGTRSKTYVLYGHRNVEYVYFKNMPSSLIPRTIFQHIAYDIIALCYFIYRKRGITYIRAKLDFLKNFKMVMKKRKEIQQNKKVSDQYLLSIMEKKWLRTRLKGK